MSSLLPWPSAYLAGSGWRSVRQLLRRCLALDRAGTLPGTIMLIGEPGLGREALAVELAAALICRTPRGLPCDCRDCGRVRRGIHPDLEVLDIATDATQIKIEQARNVVGSLAQLPFEGRRRVIVISSAHTPPLNADAASAMLKSLEEPPPHVTFVLLAGNPARCLPTIVSRSVQVRVPAPDRDELVAALAAVHGVTAEAAGAHLAACLGDGRTAIVTDPGEGGRAIVETAALVDAALAGDALAALCLGVRAKAMPETVAIVSRALVAGAGRIEALAAENALETAAALLLAERRRMALHLDAESVAVGALTRLLRPAG